MKKKKNDKKETRRHINKANNQTVINIISKKCNEKDIR